MDPTNLALFNLGPTEIIVILAVALLLFGGKKLPELARGLGRGMRLFKEELQGVKKDLDEDQAPPPSAPDRPAQQSSQDADKDQDKPS